MYLFQSERLGFRAWKEDDLDFLCKMNGSEKVMRFFPRTTNREENKIFLKRLQKAFRVDGFTFYALDRLEDGVLIGMTGFYFTQIIIPNAPDIEIGWRLHDDYWNKGYATEAALRCLQYGFSALNLKEVASFTACINKPSEHVMKKVGMKFRCEFNHPKIAAGDDLERHVLYTINRKQYENSI